MQTKLGNDSLEEKMFTKTRWVLSLLALVVVGAQSCTLNNPDRPELAGPSELGTAIDLRLIPDQLVSDGFSSSVVEAVVRDANGNRSSGRTVEFDITTAAASGFLDLGNLAPLNGARPTFGGVESGPVSAVTDGDGVARARYWAPFRTDQVNDTTVTITARESGTNFRGVFLAQADIFLRAADRPSFPGYAFCSYLVEPATATHDVGAAVFLTATQATGDVERDPPCAGNPIARYEWSVDDGTYENDRSITLSFSMAGSYSFTLTTTEEVTGCKSTCGGTLTIVDP